MYSMNSTIRNTYFNFLFCQTNGNVRFCLFVQEKKVVTPEEGDISVSLRLWSGMNSFCRLFCTCSIWTNILPSIYMSTASSHVKVSNNALRCTHPVPQCCNKVLRYNFQSFINLSSKGKAVNHVHVTAFVVCNFVCSKKSSERKKEINK